jgi:tripartite-type tricarboxylate transporter receptor subunit TctC
MKDRKPQFFTVFGTLLAISLSLTLPAVVLAADSYPSKPVRIIIPVAPGGGSDMVGRTIATRLTEKLGKQFVVESRAGAGSTLGAEMVAQSPPDGYTLLLANTAHCFGPLLYRNLSYDSEKSFVPIANLVSGPIVLAVYPGLPVKSVKELIALAKEKPGKLAAATGGVGSFSHFGTELFQTMTGVDLVKVHFKGGSQTQIDVIGGHSQMVINGIASVHPFIKSGQLRALGIGARKRSAMLPDLPTIAEAGVPGYEATNFFGLFAPAGTPRAIVDRLSNEVKSILADAETQKLYLTQGVDVDYMGPTEFGKFFAAEMVKWKKVAEDAGITPE